MLAANAVLINFLWIAGYGLDGFANATEALVGEAISAQRLATTVLCSRPARFPRSPSPPASRSCTLVCTAKASLTAIFTNEEAIRLLAGQYLPWLIVLPLVAVCSF